MSDEENKTEAQAEAGVDWEGLLRRLVEGAKNLANLRIVTVVGAVELSGEIENPKVVFPGGDGQERDVFVTNIDLVDSDVTSVIPRGYAKEGGGALDYHEAQVRQAVDSMKRKGELLMSIVERVIPALRDGEQRPGSGGG